MKILKWFGIWMLAGFFAAINFAQAQDLNTSSRTRRLLNSEHLRINPSIRIVPSNYEICVVTMAGRYSCITKRKIRERLGSLTMQEQDLIVGMLDQIAEEKGLSVSDSLAHCTGNWHKVALPSFGSGSQNIGGTRSNQLVRSGQSELIERRRSSAIKRACTSGSAHGAVGIGSGDAAYQQQVASVVSSFDSATAQCRDSGSGPVQEPGDMLGGTNAGLELEMKLNEARDQAKRDILSKHANEIARNMFPGPAMPAIKWPAIDPNSAATLSRILVVLIQVAEEAGKAAREAEDREAAKDAAMREEALAKARKEEEERRAEEEKRTPEEQEKQQCLEGGTCPSEEGSPTKMPLPPGEGNGSSCAEKQARWAAFKSRCERSSWQSYECVAFVRKLNGCVDATRIRPGPDGDMTCPVSRSDADRQRESIRQQCERLGMFARPGLDGGYTCGSQPPADIGRQGVDICNDPRVVANKDICP